MHVIAHDTGVHQKKTKTGKQWTNASPHHSPMKRWTERWMRRGRTTDRKIKWQSLYFGHKLFLPKEFHFVYACLPSVSVVHWMSYSIFVMLFHILLLFDRLFCARKTYQLTRCHQTASKWKYIGKFLHGADCTCTTDQIHADTRCFHPFLFCFCSWCPIQEI